MEVALVTRRDDLFGRRRLRAVLLPDIWPVALVFENLVGCSDVRLIEAFIRDLDATPSDNTGWFDDQVAVYFDLPDIVRVVDIDFASEHTVTLTRSNLRDLMFEWREAVVQLKGTSTY